MSNISYIREMYGVPARRGEPVEYRGRKGVVTCADGPYIRARLEGEKRSARYHPQDLVWPNMPDASDA